MASKGDAGAAGATGAQGPQGDAGPAGANGANGEVITANLPNANEFARFTSATTIEGRTVSETRSDLSLVVGTDVQAYDADLTTIAGLASTDGNFIVGSATGWVVESGATARTSLGLGSLAIKSTINNDDWSGADLAVANGGTGLSAISALSIWLANSANVITEVTPGAGNSIRVNAGGTAWEAFTPGSGGGDMVLADIQTVTGAKTFNSGKLILAGATSGTTILNSGAIAGTSVLTLPVATDTLVGKATADTFTNKTFDADGTGNSITNIENADIKAAAAISVNKLAALTASEITGTDASGFLVSLAVATYPSLTELTYVKGVTSAIQTQITAKMTNPMTTGGDVIYGGASGAPTRLANGSAGQVLTSAGTTLAPTWETVAAGANTALSNLAAVAISETLVSDTDNTDALGTTAIAWSDLFLGSGGVITFNSAPSTADITITHSANVLTFAGGSFTFEGNLVMAAHQISVGDIGISDLGVIKNYTTNNEHLIFDDVASAVNEFTITNAITGNAPSISASGGDANIDIALIPKGTGNVALGTADLTMTGSLAATGARVTKGWFTDLESTNIPTVGGTAILTSLTAPQFTTIELGHATDTTLSRSSAGVLAVEGVVIPSISSTNTLTNKRVQPRILSAASYTTDTGTSLNIDNLDIFIITAQAGALLFNAPSGTLAQGEKLIIRIKDNGTARALTWNAVFRAMGTALPSTTVVSKTLYLGFFYNSTDTKWDLVASAQES